MAVPQLSNLAAPHRTAPALLGCVRYPFQQPLPTPARLIRTCSCSHRRLSSISRALSAPARGYFSVASCSWRKVVLVIISALVRTDPHPAWPFVFTSRVLEPLHSGKHACAVVRPFSCVNFTFILCFPSLGVVSLGPLSSAPYPNTGQYTPRRAALSS